MQTEDVDTAVLLEQRVREIVARSLGLQADVIELDRRIEDLTEDSIQLFELILAFEKEFEQEADYEELMEIETVGDIVSYLRGRNIGGES